MKRNLSKHSLISRWMGKFSKTAALLTGLTIFAAAQGARAEDEKNVCVYDPTGSNGPSMPIVKDWQVKAAELGIKTSLQVHTNTQIAIADYKAGKCQFLFAPAVEIQEFARSNYSVEAVGMLPEYSDLKKMFTALANPKAARLNKNGSNVTVGFWPGGKVLLFAKRPLNSLDEFKNSKVLALPDKAANTVLNDIKATIVTASLANLAPQFKNSPVDFIYLPATAAEAFRIGPALGKTGGAVKEPIAMLTMIMIADEKVLTEETAIALRQHSLTQFDKSVAVAQKAEKKFTYLDVPENEVLRFREILKEARNKLGIEGQYDQTILKLGAKITGQ